MQFDLNEKQIAQFRVWEKEMYAKGVQLQKATIKNPEKAYEICWEDGFPYTGAIGGQFTFEFTNTSIGQAVCVRDAVTREVLDLTDFSSW